MMVFLGKTPCAFRFVGGFLFTLALSVLASLICSMPINSHGSTVLAWGAGKSYAKPPDGTNYGQLLVPANLTNAAQVAVGWSQCLALKTNGAIESWGSNILGNAAFPAASIYEAVTCGQLH